MLLLFNYLLVEKKVPENRNYFLNSLFYTIC